MVWKDSSPQNGIFELAPVTQHLIIEYIKKDLKSQQEREKELWERWIELDSLWHETRVWRASGAGALSTLTSTYPRTHTNLDIILLRQREPFHFMVEQAKKNGLYLCIRPGEITKRGCYKINPFGRYKHENITPIKNPDDLLECFKKDLNPMFCRADNGGALMPELSTSARIRLWFIHEKAKELYCAEDESEMPPRYMEGPMLGKYKERKIIQTLNPWFFVDLQRRAMKRSKNEKHRVDYERALRYAQTHPEWKQ